MARKKANITYSKPLPWADRWTEPTVEQLYEALKPHHRKVFDAVLEHLDGLDEAQQSLVWYGPSWKWTIQYSHAANEEDDPNQLCYIVCNPELPQVVVPMSEAFVDALPMRRLNRFIRETVRAAKCAVSISWGLFTPASAAEAAHLNELIDRKLKYELQGEAAE